jgi:hypothetical protein
MKYKYHETSFHSFISWFFEMENWGGLEFERTPDAKLAASAIGYELQCIQGLERTIISLTATALQHMARVSVAQAQYSRSVHKYGSTEKQ